MCETTNFETRVEVLAVNQSDLDLKDGFRAKTGTMVMEIPKNCRVLWFRRPFVDYSCEGWEGNFALISQTSLKAMDGVKIEIPRSLDAPYRIKPFKVTHWRVVAGQMGEVPVAQEVEPAGNSPTFRFKFWERTKRLEREFYSISKFESPPKENLGDSEVGVTVTDAFANGAQSFGVDQSAEIPMAVPVSRPSLEYRIPLSTTPVSEEYVSYK